ncbi:MAG: DNA (cytosine-5-)-methyltransferase [Balneolaceae bacterium]
MLSLFSGCGGMDIGFEGGFKVNKNCINVDLSKEWISKKRGVNYELKETIFETVFANDIVKHGQISWENYFSKKRDIDGVYRLESIVDIVKKHKSKNFNFPENIDVVTGGFPCQDFSVAGKRKGFKSDKNHHGELDYNVSSIETRGMLYMWMKEVIEITKPKIFIAENVKGLVSLGDVRDIIQNDFSKIDKDGYLVLNPKVLHSAHYGVPQSRERVFFIGFKRSSLSPEALNLLSNDEIPDNISPYPMPTHRLTSEFAFSERDKKLKNKTTLKSVFEDLKEPELSDDNSQKYYSKAKYYGTKVQGQKEIDLNNIGPTIRSEHHGNIEFRRLSEKNGGKHKKELSQGLLERRLTLRECARIQSFPDDFDFVIPNEEGHKKFKLSPSLGYKLVGNAVPPLLAYHLAKKIESNWELFFNKK